MSTANQIIADFVNPEYKHGFVTARGLGKGRNSKISGTQVEIGSAITWKMEKRGNAIARG